MPSKSNHKSDYNLKSAKDTPDIQQDTKFQKPSPTAISSMNKNELRSHLELALSHIDQLKVNQLTCADKEKQPHTQAEVHTDNISQMKLKTTIPMNSRPNVEPDDFVNKITLMLNTNLDTKLKEFSGQLSEMFTQTLSDKLHDLKLETVQKIKDLEENMNTKLNKVQKHNDELKHENDNLRAIVSGHQNFLESLDHENRSQDLIITGVPEDGEILEIGQKTAVDDEDKCQIIFDRIGKQTTIRSLTRLGKTEPGRNRPLKIKVANKMERESIIENARKLKDRTNAHSITNKIFIKKDQHPLIRNEWKRLNEVWKREKDKPENQEKVVEMDRKSRTVKVGGQIIDRFQGT